MKTEGSHDGGRLEVGRPRRKLTLARRATRPLVPVIILALVACSSTDEQEPQPETAPDTEPSVLTEPEDPTPHVPITTVDETAFAHIAHVGIRCQTCHEPVVGHTTHTSVGCTDCHAVPTTFAATRTPSEGECLTCHHVENHALTCDQCHRLETIMGLKSPVEPMRFPGWEQPRERELPFDHAWHESVECKECHTESTSAEVTGGCASCHENHHRAEADCTRCHDAGAPEAHPETIHTGCAGAGCHVDPLVTALPPSRTLCLVCHRDQVEHEPAGDCAVCHGMTLWGGTRAPTSPGARS